MFQRDMHSWGQGLGVDRKWWVWKRSHDAGTLTFFHTSERNLVLSSSLLPIGDQTQFLRFAQQAPSSTAILSALLCFLRQGFLVTKVGLDFTM